MRPQGPGGQIGRTRGGPGLSQSGHRGWQKVAQQWPQPHPCWALSWAALSFPSSWGLLRPPQDILSRAQSLVNKQHCQQTGPQQARERCQDSAECAISPTGANSGKGDCQNPPLLSSHKSFPLKKKKKILKLYCVRNASPRVHIGGLRSGEAAEFFPSFQWVLLSGVTFLRLPGEQGQGHTRTQPLGFCSYSPGAFWRRLSICH